MFRKLNEFICLGLAFSIFLTVTARAQQTVPLLHPAAGAPVPAQIVSAHKVFVANGGASNYFNAFTGGADRVYSSFYAAVQDMGAFQLVDSPAQADVVLQVKAIAPLAGVGDDAAPNPQLVLSILDPASGTALWATSANVRALGTKKRRDRMFDASVAVLVDKLTQVTGHPLSAQQAKAVRDNSGWTPGMKIFLIVGLALFAGLTTYGYYRVSHPPSLPPLQNPQPVFP